MIKSFLNYPGGKYQLLDQLDGIFPKRFDRLVDLFTGSAVVSVNFGNRATKVEAYDNNRQLIELLKFVQAHPGHKIIEQVLQVINDYQLSDTYSNGYEYYNANSGDGLAKVNKKGFMALREAYNKSIKNGVGNPVLLYTLIVFGFNNQIRFNRSNLFNNPVGKRDFNNVMQKKLIDFSNMASEINILFDCKDFRDVDNKEENSFFYADPPYLISTAVYNENGGWSDKDEQDLLNYLDEIDSNNNQFALSNVLALKGKENELLSQWSQKYNVHHLNKEYANSNYHAKNTTAKTDEVLITNF